VIYTLVRQDIETQEITYGALVMGTNMCRKQFVHEIRAMGSGDAKLQLHHLTVDTESMLLITVKEARVKLLVPVKHNCQAGKLDRTQFVNLPVLEIEEKPTYSLLPAFQ